MTDTTFVQQTEVQQNSEEGFQTSDKEVNTNSGQDTRSIEYQLQVMQKRLNDKDEFINKLQEENQEIRQMYASLDERFKNLSKIEEVLNKEQVVSNQDTSLDEHALVEKVIETFNVKQTEAKMQENFNAVINRLKAEVGEANIESKVAEAAKANGLTIDDMRETARKSPTAFYKLVGLDTPRQVVTPPPMRGSQVTPQDTGEKDFAYYSKLMRENPREYWKPSTQREFRKLFLEKDKN